MILINHLGFYASHTAAFCNMAGTRCLCFCIHWSSPFFSLSKPWAHHNIILCTGETRHKKNYRRGDRTSTEIRIISLLHAKIGGGDSHAEMKQERLAAQRSCFMF